MDRPITWVALIARNQGHAATRSVCLVAKTSCARGTPIDKQSVPPRVAADTVRVRDLHATILHLLGIDHHHFKFKFRGFDLGLTGVYPAHVVKELLG